MANLTEHLAGLILLTEERLYILEHDIDYDSNEDKINEHIIYEALLDSLTKAMTALQALMEINPNGETLGIMSLESFEKTLNECIAQQIKKSLPQKNNLIKLSKQHSILKILR